MSEPQQTGPAWQKVTVIVEDPDGATVTATFPRVEGFTLDKRTGFTWRVAPRLRRYAG